MSCHVDVPGPHAGARVTTQDEEQEAKTDYTHFMRPSCTVPTAETKALSVQISDLLRYRCNGSRTHPPVSEAQSRLKCPRLKSLLESRPLELTIASSIAKYIACGFCRPSWTLCLFPFASLARLPAFGRMYSPLPPAPVAAPLCPLSSPLLLPVITTTAR